MTQIKISLNLEDILPSTDIVLGAREAIGYKINEYFHGHIKELITNYIYQVLTKETDEVFLNNPECKEIIKESVLSAIKDMSYFQIFRKAESTCWGDRKDSTAQKALDEYCNSDEFKDILKNQINEVVVDRIKSMSLDDFVYLMSDGMANIIKNVLVKEDKHM